MAKQKTNFRAINLDNKDERLRHRTHLLLFSAMATHDYRSNKYQTIALALAQWRNRGALSFMHDTLRYILYSLLAISGETRGRQKEFTLYRHLPSHPGLRRNDTDVKVLNALLVGQLWTIIFIRKHDGVISLEELYKELEDAALHSNCNRSSLWPLTAASLLAPEVTSSGLSLNPFPLLVLRW
jgi:hypothetical protein